MASSPQPPVAEPRASLGLPELEQAIHAVDPRALLVPQRILRRVIKQHAGIAGIGLRVPHRKTYILSRQDLLAIVEPPELDRSGRSCWPIRSSCWPARRRRRSPRSRPTRCGSSIGGCCFTPGSIWRSSSRWPTSGSGRKVRGSGSPSWAKPSLPRFARCCGRKIFCCRRATTVRPTSSSRPSIWNCGYFARHLLPAYFPELRDIGRVDDIVGQDLDAAGLLAATRPPGAPDVVPRGELAGGAAPPLPRRAERSVSARAERTVPSGCEKRPSAWRGRAMWCGRRYCALGRPSSSTVRAPRRGAAAESDLGRLVERLDAVCGFSPDDGDEWSRALVPLLEYAARGVWPPEARLLYDLQKACLDQERGVYALNFWQWAYSLGQKPLKRPLPAERDVLVVKHLGEAAARFLSTRIAERPRRRLATLLETATQRCRHNCGRNFAGRSTRCSIGSRLVPHNLPERVARQKMVDELVDRIVKRGFLAMGDLRDALSRNNLKLPDVDTVGFRSVAVGRPVAGDRSSAGRRTGRRLSQLARFTCVCRSGSARWPSARRWGGF